MCNENADKRGSEVARLLSQISAEYEAAQQGLTGLTYGMSQHEFISARMENMGNLHRKLQSIVGDEAIAMIVQRIDGPASNENKLSESERRDGIHPSQ